MYIYITTMDISFHKSHGAYFTYYYRLVPKVNLTVPGWTAFTKMFEKSPLKFNYLEERCTYVMIPSGVTQWVSQM